MRKRRSHTFDQRTIYQLHILGITIIVARQLNVESRISINTKYRVPTGFVFWIALKNYGRTSLRHHFSSNNQLIH